LLTPSDEIRLKSCSKAVPYNHLWFTRCHGSGLSDEEYNFAILCRYGIDQRSAPSYSCKSNSPVCKNTLHRSELHYLHCPLGGATILRHNGCGRIMEAYLRHDLGCVVDWEPRVGHLRKRDRVDVITVVGGHSWWIDFFVTNPCAPSYSKKFSDPFGAVNAAAQAKVRHYSKLASDAGATFVPFGMTTFGGFHAESVRFLKILASLSHSQNPDVSEATFLLDLVHLFQVAILRGNYSCFEQHCLLNTPKDVLRPKTLFNIHTQSASIDNLLRDVRESISISSDRNYVTSVPSPTHCSVTTPPSSPTPSIHSSSSSSPPMSTPSTPHSSPPFTPSPDSSPFIPRSPTSPSRSHSRSPLTQPFTCSPSSPSPSPSSPHTQPFPPSPHSSSHSPSSFVILLPPTDDDDLEVDYGDDGCHVNFSGDSIRSGCTDRCCSGGSSSSGSCEFRLSHLLCN
jgi:hypothetical protein